MLKIEITNGDVIEQDIPYNDKKTGAAKVFKKLFQVGWAHLLSETGQHDPHPSKVEIQLEEKQAAFAPGVYQLHPASIYVDHRQKMQLGRPRLVKLAQSVKAAA